VGRSPLGSVNVDGPGTKGGVLASPALFRHYRANIMGTSGQTYINAFAGSREARPRSPHSAPTWPG